MPISMNCPSCGKTLSAPDNAAGKNAKCPACGNLMIVPTGVVEAEVIGPAGQEPAPNEFRLMDDLLASAPSQSPASSAGAGPEPGRQPCPECGEMIVKGAAKCRFCNAIFDPALKHLSSARLGGSNIELKRIASYQRGVISCILVQILAYMAYGSLKANLALAGVASLVVIIAVVSGVVYAVLLATRVYSTGAGIAMGLLALVPCLGLVMLLIINQAATRKLTENGIKVGFFGASMSQF